MNVNNVVLEKTRLASLVGNGMGRGNDQDSPAMLMEEVCLIPGAPVVRVEVAPGNARRIFTGIDMLRRRRMCWSACGRH